MFRLITTVAFNSHVTLIQAYPNSFRCICQKTHLLSLSLFEDHWSWFGVLYGSHPHRVLVPRERQHCWSPVPAANMPLLPPVNLAGKGLRLQLMKTTISLPFPQNQDPAKSPLPTSFHPDFPRVTTTAAGPVGLQLQLEWQPEGRELTALLLHCGDQGRATLRSNPLFPYFQVERYTAGWFICSNSGKDKEAWYTTMFSCPLMNRWM